MELGPIQWFLSNDSFELQLNVFLTVIPALEKIQFRNGEVQFQDMIKLLNIIILGSEDIESTDEVKSYAGIIYEAAFAPKMLKTHPSFQIRKEVIGNQNAFISSILQELKAHVFDASSNAKVEALRKEAAMFFFNDPVDPENFKRAEGRKSEDEPVVMSTYHNEFSQDSEETQSRLPNLQESQGSAHEPLVRLLANIRKSGMDVIFPQFLHDKLLLAIYSAIRCCGPVAHRELMDMLMAVRDSKILEQFDTITKTKVRGVFSLLKNSHSLDPVDGIGEGVRLYLGRGVKGFKEFRDKHDAFLTKCILQQRLFIPINVKKEFLWQWDPSDPVTFTYFDELFRLENLLQEFFQNGKGKFIIPSQQHNTRSNHNQGSFSNREGKNAYSQFQGGLSGGNQFLLNERQILELQNSYAKNQMNNNKGAASTYGSRPPAFNSSGVSNHSFPPMKRDDFRDERSSSQRSFPDFNTKPPVPGASQFHSRNISHGYPPSKSDNSLDWDTSYSGYSGQEYRKTTNSSMLPFESMNSTYSNPQHQFTSHQQFSNRSMMNSVRADPESVPNYYSAREANEPFSYYNRAVNVHQTHSPVNIHHDLHFSQSGYSSAWNIPVSSEVLAKNSFLESSVSASNIDPFELLVNPDILEPNAAKDEMGMNKNDF